MVPYLAQTLWGIFEAAERRGLGPGLLQGQAEERDSILRASASLSALVLGTVIPATFRCVSRCAGETAAGRTEENSGKKGRKSNLRRKTHLLQLRCLEEHVAVVTETQGWEAVRRSVSGEG